MSDAGEKGRHRRYFQAFDSLNLTRTGCWCKSGPLLPLFGRHRGCGGFDGLKDLRPVYDFIEGLDRIPIGR